MLDLRFALRRLRAAPGFAAAAILTLALGIGANTLTFSAIRGLLIQPIPFPHGGSLVLSAAAACAVPAWRAASVSPAVTLRAE
jgi:hypothetical protein